MIFLKMSDKQKKLIEYAIGFALSIAGGYFVIYVQLNDLLSWPSYVTNMLSIFIGVLLLIFFLSFVRFLIVSYQDSKQIPYPSVSVVGRRNSKFRYWTEQWQFGDFMWEVEYNIDLEKVYEVRGPYCPKEECRTELNVRKTYFGRHKYTCPACSFKQTVNENAYTLESNLEKVSKAKFDKQNGKWSKRG